MPSNFCVTMFILRMVCVSTNSQKVYIQQSASVLIIQVYSYMMFIQQ